MFMRGVRVTFTNQLMKESVLGFISREMDLTGGMMMVFRCHLSENQLLNIMLFPDEDTANRFGESARPYLEQIKETGAKIEFLSGDVSHFGVSLGGGLGKVAGKVFRIGHLGWLNEAMVLQALGGAELAMRHCGVEFRAGAGVGAAIESFTETREALPLAAE